MLMFYSRSIENRISRLREKALVYDDSDNKIPIIYKYSNETF